MKSPLFVSLLLAASAALAQEPIALYSEETIEPAKHLARDVAKNILHDQKAIWTSPSHMPRKDSGLWLTFERSRASEGPVPSPRPVP